MAKIHVLLKKEELSGDRLAGKVVVVLDILFATTTMVTALAHGAREVIPVANEAEALEAAKTRAHRSCRLAGEWLAQPIAGFAPATPLALLEETGGAESLIYCTTNGTVALRAADHADEVYAAALTNAAATAEHILRAHRDQTVVLVCAGSANRFNLEDFFGAGQLVSRLLERREYALSDAAAAALLLRRGSDAEQCLRASGVGRMMCAAGLGHEVDHAAKCDVTDLVARLERGILRATPSR